MPSLAPEQMRPLAVALVRLRGETLGRIAEATGIRTANLSVWLRGKEQVISEKRLVGLLHYLGIEGGQLRSDMLHLWQDGGSLEDCRMVLAALLGDGERWLFQDEEPGLAKTRFLLAGKTLIRVQIEPGIAVASDLAEVFETDRLLTVSMPLSGVPTNSPEAARDELLALAEQYAIDVGDEELLDGLLHRLNEDYVSQLGFDTAPPREWQQLEEALRAALKASISPGDIARVVDDHSRKGGKAARGRNQDSI